MIASYGTVTAHAYIYAGADRDDIDIDDDPIIRLMINASARRGTCAPAQRAASSSDPAQCTRALRLRLVF